MSSSTSMIKRFITGLDFFPRKKVEDFIYYDTKGLLFYNLHPEFQRIMMDEFSDYIKEFQKILNSTINK